MTAADRPRMRLAPSLRFSATVGVFTLLGPLFGFLTLVIFSVFACLFLPADCGGIGTRLGAIVMGLLVYAYRSCLLFALVVGIVTALVAHHLGRIPGWLEFVLVPAAIFVLGVPLLQLGLHYLAPVPSRASANPIYFAVTMIGATIAAQLCRRLVLPLYREPANP